MQTQGASKQPARLSGSAPIKSKRKSPPRLRRTQSAPEVSRVDDQRIRLGNERTIALGDNNIKLKFTPAENQSEPNETKKEQESPQDTFKREVTEYTGNLKETLAEMTDEQKKEHLFGLEFTMLNQYVRGRDSKNGETEDQKEDRGHRMAPLYGIDPIKHETLPLEEHIKRVAKLSVRFKNDFN